MNICLVKINGWPDTFNERVEIIARNVDHITLVRPAPVGNTEQFEEENITVYELYPRRGESITTLWLHFLIFPVYIMQATLICSIIQFRSPNRPDIYHAIDYVLGGLVTTIVAKIFRSPNIVSVRGLTGPRYKHMVNEDGSYIAKLNYKIVTMIPRFVLPRTDAVITKAPYQAAYLQEEFGVTVSIYTIPTGVDFEKFNPEHVRCDSILDEVSGRKEPTKKVILHLGRLTADKGIDLLVNMIEKTETDLPPDLMFLCVGRYRNEDFKSTIESRSAHLDDRLVIHSTPIPYERVPELFACVDGAILLSEAAHEGTPRVLQEAYAMKRPIIASNVVGISNAFKDLPGCFLIDRDSEDAFIDAIEEIVTGEIRTDRKKAKNRFDIHQNYAKYRDIYERTVQKY